MGGASVADASGMRPGLVSEQVTFPKRLLFGNVANRYYQNGAMTCQLTGARRLRMTLEALLIAVTLAKHLKFNSFKNFEGSGLEPLREESSRAFRFAVRPHPARRSTAGWPR